MVSTGNLTEELKTFVTLTPDGDKEIRELTIIKRDGEVISKSNHRYVVMRDEEVPPEIAEMIEQRKVKHPKRPDDPGDVA